MQNRSVSKKPSIIIVTGISGSGKSTALKALEDFGCEVIDNLPIELCFKILKKKQVTAPLALGIDIRTRGFDPSSFHLYLEKLRADPTFTTTLLFFEADSDVIERRYRESRRQHPLGLSVHVRDLICEEKRLLSPMREIADHLINTSAYSPPEMRSFLQNTLGFKNGLESALYFLSFAYRRGIPVYADFVFDMRCLPNPFYEEKLKFLTGKSKEIWDYFQGNGQFQSFMELFERLVFDVVLLESRPAFVFAFGCTGGRHRSVFAAETARKLVEKRGQCGYVFHRDLV